jgi:hypothetical protein
MIRCVLSALGLAMLAIVGTVIHYEGVLLPIVGQVVDGEIASRLESYVALSEKKAAEAKAAEVKRQADAVRAATEQFRKRAMEAEGSEAIAQIDLEKRIALNEQRLLEAKRRCDLDADDVDSILHHR